MITRRQLLKLGLGLLSTQFIPLGIDTSQRGDVVSAAPVDPPTLPLTSTPPRVVSKVGVHVVSGSRTGFGTFVQNCAAAGHPVAVVKCVDDFGAAYDAKHASALTLTVGRINDINTTDMGAWNPANYSSAAAAAQTYFNMVKGTWSLNPWIDVWETFNEMSSDWGWQADFYIKMMDLAEADGYRLGLWSASVGNPPEDAYPDIARACQRAAQHGNHILCLHEYGGIWNLTSGLLKDESPYLVTRYRQLYAYLRQQSAVIPLVISECGQNGGGGLVSRTDFFDDYTWYDDQLMRDNYVLGCAAWTLGNWSGANFQGYLLPLPPPQNYLPNLTDYVINKFYRSYLPLITSSF